MENALLDDFIALNDQLVALAEAGVPFDVGEFEPRQPLPQALSKVSGTVVRRVSRGESLAEAVEGDDEVPPEYRSLVQFGLRTGDLAGALTVCNRGAEAVDSSRFSLRLALIYPLLICLLAYAGLIALCLFLVPVLEDMQESMRLATGPALRVLQGLRDTLPYWAPVPPLLLLAYAAWKLASKSRQPAARVEPGGVLKWLPGVSQLLFHERSAKFAGTLATLVESDVPLDQALLIAGEASGDRRLGEGAKSLSEALRETGQFPNKASDISHKFPPFLKWAIWDSDQSTGRTRALQIAARTYRDAAERRRQRIQTLAPIFAVLLVGGTVTLLYCLALFVPVIEMLRSIAAAPIGTVV